MKTVFNGTALEFNPENQKIKIVLHDKDINKLRNIENKMLKRKCKRNTINVYLPKVCHKYAESPDKKQRRYASIAEMLTNDVKVGVKIVKFQFIRDFKAIIGIRYIAEYIRMIDFELSL